MGVNAALYKTTCFGVSALYAGVAGGLSAIAVGFVSPESFGLAALARRSWSGSWSAASRRSAACCSAPCSSSSCPISPTSFRSRFGESAKALPGAIYGALLILVMARDADGSRRRAAGGGERRVRGLLRLDESEA